MNKFVSRRWLENLSAKCILFLVLRCYGNFQVNVHIIIQMGEKNRKESNQEDVL